MFGIDDTAAAYLGGAGLSAIGSAFSGGDEPAKGNLHLVNPAQQYAYNQMIEALLSGSGDYGFGNSFKQGKDTLQNQFADAGISQDSGYYGAAMGNLAGTAAATDQQNRFNSLLGVLRSPLQTQVVDGANFIPGSPSRGVDQRRQTNQFFSGNSGNFGNFGYYGKGY